MTRPRRSAFAMPLVLLVVVVAAIVMVALVESSRGRFFFVRRQLDGYVEHHSAKGLQEAISAWIGSNGGSGVQDALDADGKAFDIVAGGQRVRVYFAEAQGTALADFTGLTGQDLADAAGVVDKLASLPQNVRDEAVRREGPLSISVYSAQESVLRAVAETVLRDTRARDLLGEVVGARTSPDFDQNKLREAIARSGAAGDEQSRLQRLLTAEPSLWALTAEVAPANGPGEAVYYEGLAIIASPGRSAQRISNNVQRSNAFLSWRRVERPSRLRR